MIVSSDNGTPEIFYTLQGEGTSCGRPAIFLRLSNCNLFCVWCDTPYTWNFEKTNSDHPEKYIKTEQQTILNLKEVAEGINHFREGAILVITGGEPLLQQISIVELLYGNDLNVDKVEIETNGTIAPDVELFDRVQFNVSLKLSNSGMSQDKRLKSNAIAGFVEANSIFKFVIDNEEDIEEVQSIVDRYAIDNSRVWLMPQGRTEQELNRKLPWLAEVCIVNGFNLTNRLHVQTWGAKRGV